MTRLLRTALLLLAAALLHAQSGSWKGTAYVSSPSASRLNDGFFLTKDLGWIVNGIGQIHRTTDGGATWTKQLDKGSFTHFRSVGFFDAQRGFAGALGWGDVNNTSAKDSVILYTTTNGGATWLPEPQLTSRTIERGFCGMHVFDDSVVYAVGRVRGPAWFYKTTDRGATWQATDMTPYAAGLIDVRFFTRDSGLIVGLTDTTHTQSRAIILSTADGGASWDTVHVTSRTNEWAWKITFPSRRTGYVSLQRNSNVAPVYILKTTDGGITWHDKLFSGTGYFVQGLGFLNDTLGWGGGTTLAPKQTTDGGETWTPMTIGNQLNRFRKVNDSLMYVVGASVWKYTVGTTAGAVRPKDALPSAPMLAQNYPNPFNPRTTIEFTVPEEGHTVISVYDVNGQWVRTLFSGPARPGRMSVSWDGRIESDEEAASGTYFYRLETKRFTESKKMILLR